MLLLFDSIFIIEEYVSRIPMVKKKIPHSNKLCTIEWVDDDNNDDEDEPRQ
jgi:hypothetical protein